jgi:hypothetical protein
MSISAVGICIIAGSVSQPSLAFQNDLTIGFYYETSDSISVAIQGVKKAVFSNSLELLQTTIAAVNAADSGFYKVFVDQDSNLQGIDSSGNVAYAGLLLSKVPRYDFANFSLTGLQKYIDNIAYCNNPIINVFNTNDVFLDGVSEAYYSGVYSPTNNFIYLMPDGQSKYTGWHYLQCSNNLYNTYFCTSDGQYPGTIFNFLQQGNNNYHGGVYSPTQNRIYPIPNTNDSYQTVWQYIDCATGFVNTYASVPLCGTYEGGVYSPTQNRIYFIPAGGNGSQWLYIDCNTGLVTGYPSTPGLTGHGGCYSPNENKIYFCSSPANGPLGGYIDCNTGQVGTYSLSGLPSMLVFGSAYSPLQNRIYMIPYAAGNYDTWFYIDCYTGTAVPFKHGLTNIGNQVFLGAVYSPVHNRIFLAPDFIQTVNYWFYIDCKTGLAGYIPNTTALLSNPYMAGGIFCPTTNVTHIIPKVLRGDTYSVYIDDVDAQDIVTSTIMMSGALFNKM